MRAFLAGILFTGLVFALGAFISVTQGWIPANADAKPGMLETWAAHTSLHATLKREAPKGPNPVALTDANLIAGIKLYSENCAMCHGLADAKPSHIAVGLYQHAPQLAKDGVEDDPEGYTYWKVKHGIRLTGMPSFTTTLTDQQIWQLALFLKHMNSLSPAAKKVWENLKS